MPFKVPKIYDSFTKNKNRYLVLEQIDGESLASFISCNNKINYSEFKFIAIQIITVLQKIHKLNIVWRDCKPDNFIYNIKTKLITPIDFEGACLMNSKQIMSWSSPGFTPPECDIFKKHRVTEKFDLYSLGSLFYFMITQEVYNENTDKKNLYKVRRKFPKKILDVVTNLLDCKASNRMDIESIKNIFNEN